MPDKTDKQSLEQIAESLPEAMRTAFKKYTEFAAENHEDAADFKKRQEACKIAVAHIDLLFKLAKSNGLMREEKDIEAQDDVAEMIEGALAEIAEYEREKGE